jgi:hypothetical protein
MTLNIKLRIMEIEEKEVERIMVFEMQDRFAQIAGLENLTLGVDIDNSEEITEIRDRNLEIN